MFFKPLKRSENSNIVDPNLVDEIFFQIPEICASHEIFLDQVKNRVNNWSDQQIIGDVFVSSVSCILFCSALFFFQAIDCHFTSIIKHNFSYAIQEEHKDLSGIPRLVIQLKLN